MSNYSPELLAFLKIVEQDKVWWNRKDGGSQDYKDNVPLVKEGIKEGLIMYLPKNEHTCRKDYMLTRMGLAVLRE